MGPEHAELRISTLGARHPSVSFPTRCITQLITRLAVDPIAIPADQTSRQVLVDHRSRQEPDNLRTITRLVSWEDLYDSLRDECLRDRHTIPDDEITEWAAIGMMGLLIHDLEQATVVSVLPKGIGGDYKLRLLVSNDVEHIEVSGIRVDGSPNGVLTIARVREKTQQILQKQPTGYVSVTSFSYGISRVARSFLLMTTRADAGDDGNR